MNTDEADREEMRDRLRDRILEFHGRDGSDDSDMALATGLADALMDVVHNEAAEQRAGRAEGLLRDLIDNSVCEFDQNGGCQAHGYLSLDPGELCPQAEAKAFLAELDQDKD